MKYAGRPTQMIDEDDNVCEHYVSVLVSVCVCLCAFWCSQDVCVSVFCVCVCVLFVFVCVHSSLTNACMPQFVFNNGIVIYICYNPDEFASLESACLSRIY